MRSVFLMLLLLLPEPSFLVSLALPTQSIKQSIKQSVKQVEVKSGPKAMILESSKTAFKPANNLSPSLKAVINKVPKDVRVGVLVRQVGGGPILEYQRADEPFIPASSLKLLTGASVLTQRGGFGGWWSTSLTIPPSTIPPSTVSSKTKTSVPWLTLRGSGDPTLSINSGNYSLRALAKQAYARGIRQVGQLRINDAVLDASTWKKAEIGVPMTALKLIDWHDNPPKSANEARIRIGNALLIELKRAGITVKSAEFIAAKPYKSYIPPVLKDKDGNVLPSNQSIPLALRPEQGIATVRSDSVYGILAATERPSDNLWAEQLLSSLAVKPDGNGTLAGALARERSVLRQMGIDLSTVKLADGSGLSRENRLAPRTLVQLLTVMYDLPYPKNSAKAEAALLPKNVYQKRLNGFAEALPQAGTGEDLPKHNGRGGTLALRLVNKGIDVRAKTGTLEGVSVLCGYLTSKTGKTLAFALMMNGPKTAPILTLRALQDEAVQAIAAAY